MLQSISSVVSKFYLMLTTIKLLQESPLLDQGCTKLHLSLYTWTICDYIFRIYKKLLKCIICEDESWLKLLLSVSLLMSINLLQKLFHTGRQKCQRVSQGFKAVINIWVKKGEGARKQLSVHSLALSLARTWLYGLRTTLHC